MNTTQFIPTVLQSEKLSGIKILTNRDFRIFNFSQILVKTPLDVVDIQAMTVANTRGEIEKLLWKKPNVVPKITIDDACIELLNSKSKFKVFHNLPGWGDYSLGGR